MNKIHTEAEEKHSLNGRKEKRKYAPKLPCPGRRWEGIQSGELE
jgi:hypothetical protein